MRALVAVLFVTLFFAACLDNTEKGEADAKAPVVLKRAGEYRTTIPVDQIKAEGATPVQMPDGSVRLEWESTIAGTFNHEIEIPPEALVMRARYQVRISDAGGTGTMTVVEPESGNARCFTTTSLAPSPDGNHYVTCTGITVLDTDLERSAKYSIRLSGGSAPANNQEAAGTPYLLTLDLIPGPLDGPAAHLNLGALAKRQFKLAPQTTHYVPSSLDGARIFVEVNLPDGPGPWPTVFIASPYNQPTRDAGQLTQGPRVRDFVPRGYALVVADVRGFANSEGCVEVWGPKEQQDQYDVVEWIAAQPWSDGGVAMYGQSYVGTTPHEAAVKKPPHLRAIATVAGLTDPYFDWHYGGVPNGESSASPAAYSVTTDQPPRPPTNPMFVPDWFSLARTQGCDLAPMLVAANDPNAVHGEFYDERNFTAKAHEIEVPVLYTQGYIDANVKVAQAIRFFDAIPTEKIGIFGPWLHRHPPRGDFDLLLHAWMDRWLMERPTNVEAYPDAQAITNVDTLRYDSMWPPQATGMLELFPNFATTTLDTEAPKTVGEVQYVSTVGPANVAAEQGFAVLESKPVASRTYIAGSILLEFVARVQGGDNAHFGANLVDVDAKGNEVEIAFGMLNFGLRNGYEEFEPMPRDENVALRMTMLPTEYVLLPGHKLKLSVGPATGLQSATVPTEVTIQSGGDPVTRLVVPTLTTPSDFAAPTSVLGFEAFQTR